MFDFIFHWLGVLAIDAVIVLLLILAFCWVADKMDRHEAKKREEKLRDFSENKES